MLLYASYSMAFLKAEGLPITSHEPLMKAFYCFWCTGITIRFIFAILILRAPH